ncbi:hypothetical protein CF54_04085 [Streptomyces sp. Tu 6176]|nr:hypothetical protein CF54_04085 [Streptomyces sp. Tu 6176]
MIESAYRVQCDGPGKEWLPPAPGQPAGIAGAWPSERDAKRAAVAAGWRHRPDSDFRTWFCPACEATPQHRTAP